MISPVKRHEITLTVNGIEHQLSVASHKTLLELLRDQLGLTETKYGCGTGECGACTVLVEEPIQPGIKRLQPVLKRNAINSCLTLAVTMNSRSIITAAGLEQDGELHPVQQAFIDEAAIQCGYCTPGMVLKSVSLLEKNPNPSEAEIREGLEGNICRCTGYAKIVKAVQAASTSMVQYAGGEE